MESHSEQSEPTRIRQFHIALACFFPKILLTEGDVWDIPKSTEQEKRLNPETFKVSRVSRSSWLFELGSIASRFRTANLCGINVTPPAMKAGRVIAPEENWYSGQAIELRSFCCNRCGS